MSASFRFCAVFGAVFAILYVVAMESNWAAFTYHPRPMEFGLGVEPARDGPAMYWYGWLATSALGGATLGLIAMALPANVPRLWHALAWVWPRGGMIAAGYFMIPFFTR